MGSEKEAEVEVEVEVVPMAASLNPDTPQKDTEAVSTVRAKRGRGRPPKWRGIAERETETEEDGSTVGAKQGRGRPPKWGGIAEREMETEAGSTVGAKRERGRPPKWRGIAEREMETEEDGSTVGVKRGRGRPPKPGGITEGKREMEMEATWSAQNAQSSSSEYEKVREERIRANMERMQKLGLRDLSRDVKSAFSHHKRRHDGALLPADGSRKKIELTPLLPPRRSSRLQNVAPVVYYEARVKKSGDLEDANTALIEEGRREEYYTELPWTLFVDGYSKDGTRIYDQVKGKTCHQCRQKTLGYRTSCCKCQLVQGQFCGDCLYMRYGENVLEAMKNPDWICPACRGICNCSLCRLRKGWNPTGALYKKVASLGYKSVAHYLIQTRRKPANSSEVKSDETEAAKENQPEPETVSKKSNASVTVLSSGESGASDDEPGTAKRRRGARREKEELYWENVASGPVASRLRSCQKKV